MPKITTKRRIGGGYHVNCDGRDTGLVILKDTQQRRQWGAPQEWDVCTEAPDDLYPHFLFSANGQRDALDTLQTLANRLQGGG